MDKIRKASFEDVSLWLTNPNAQADIEKWLRRTKGEKSDKYKNRLRQQVGAKAEIWAHLARTQSYHWRRVRFGETEFQYELLPEDWQGLFALDGVLRAETGLILAGEESIFRAQTQLEEAFHWSQLGTPLLTRRRAKVLVRQEQTPETPGEKWFLRAVDMLGQATLFSHTEQLPAAVESLRALDPDAPAQRQSLPLAGQRLDPRPEEWHHPLLGIWAQQFLLEKDTLDDRSALLVIGQHVQNLMHRAGYRVISYVSPAVIKVRTAGQGQRVHQQVQQTQDLSPYFDYQRRALWAAVNSLRGYVRRKQEDRRQAARFERIAGINGRQAQIIKWILDEPEAEFTLKEIQSRYNVVYQTARTDVMALEENGLLEKYIEGKKKQVYRRGAQFERRLADLLG